MTWILRGPNVLDVPLAGGKARGLARMERGGLPVPAWFVLSGAAFTDSVTREQRDAIESASDASAIQRVLHDVSVHSAVRAAIDVAVRELCAAGQMVAVRSSAIEEDGAVQSFAGQFESFLNVPAAHVVDRVVDVWRSALTPRLCAYYQEHRLRRTLRAPAVLIQRMVRPRAAGVAFSADPVSGRRGVAVVSAVHGLGSALVSGEAEADTWLIDRRGTIVERRIVPKGPSLSDDEVLAVAQLARAAERLAGRPQDIEWALADRLVLLQARPVTTLQALPDPDASRAIWDNSNIVESYSGVTTPLTFSFARDAYRHVYPQFCRLMGVRKRAIADHDEMFTNMLGLVRGRLYYNLLNWYRMLALLPGYRANRRFMEQMMGVKEPLAETLAAEVANAGRGRALDALALLRTLGGLLLNHLTLDRQVKAFFTRIDAALAPPSPPLEDRRPDELVAHYRELRRRLLHRWDAPIVNDFFAMIFYGLLRHLTTRWLKGDDAALQNDLVGGEGGMVSAEPAIRMQGLARLAASDPVLLDRLRGGTVEEIRLALEARPEFLNGCTAYLDRFGERTVNELKLESLTLHDDPLPLFRAIGALGSQLSARGGVLHPPPSPADRLRVAARARVTRELAYRPLRRVVFLWVLAQARRRVRDRENLRLERTRLFGRVRRIFLEIGRRLHALNILDDPRDVLYLEVEEVLSFVDGRSTCINLRALAAMRKDEFTGYQDGVAPDDRFETRGIVYAGHDFRRVNAVAERDGEERRGLGCSPGVVRGRVRIVTNPNDVDLSERSILVAEHTDPGWIMLFPSALAVLVERGSLLSHAAIVARELGIPAVVSVPGITQWLRDGDCVEMDGATGIVRRVSGTTAAEPARCA